ncbi:MAG TPA: hypothetical protein VHN98_07265 [Acidimicrobiales bacterium]|nr:hypothetical protein [Acidimicrobiales bacterium]
MRSIPRAVAGAVLLLVVGLSAAACGGTPAASAAATPAGKIGTLPAGFLPSEVLGLAVAPEDVSAQIKGVDRSYADAVGMYSFRSDDLLQATLQVTKFNDRARWRSAAFRLQVVSQVGGSVPSPVKVGDDTVYLTRGTKQSLAIWFRGPYLFVLATREEYLRPRALLREMLKVKP